MQKTITGKIGDENFEHFIKLPYLLYPANSLRLQQHEQFVSEFDSDYVLVLNEENAPLARAILFYNHELNYNGQPALPVGYFEAINDRQAVEKLFNQLCILAQNKGAKYLIGPMNGSTWDQHRFNTSNKPLFLTEHEHLPYYNELFRQTGFDVIANYYSNISPVKDASPILSHDYKLALEAKGVTIRRLNLNDFENEIRRVFHFSLEMFKGNFLYTPISRESFYAKYLPIKNLLNSNYILLAEADGELVGFLFAIHDYYNKEHKNIIVKTIARNHKPDFSGLAALMGDTFLKQAQVDNYESVIHAFIHQHNKSSQFSRKKYSGDHFKEYELYARELK